MKTREPTLQEIDELVSFLPRLYAEGVAAIERWDGGAQREDGISTIPWPEYREVVREFFRLASGECWSDYDYRAEKAGQMLENDEFMKAADLGEIKTMLTYCVRGERFCDGHWGVMIESGHVLRLLQRLAELASNNA